MLIGTIMQDKTHLPVATGQEFLQNVVKAINVFSDSGEIIVVQGTSSKERSLASSLLAIFDEMSKQVESRRAGVKVTLLGKDVSEDLELVPLIDDELDESQQIDESQSSDPFND